MLVTPKFHATRFDRIHSEGVVISGGSISLEWDNWDPAFRTPNHVPSCGFCLSPEDFLAVEGELLRSAEETYCVVFVHFARETFEKPDWIEELALVRIPDLNDLPAEGVWAFQVYHRWD